MIPAHEIANSLGPLKCSGLPMFHAFTGCDTTSSFCGIGKKTGWLTWKVFPEVSNTFQSLSKHDLEITEEHTDALQRFAVLLYSKTLEVNTVNEAREFLHSQGTRTLNKMAPTLGALTHHIRRSGYHAGHVWGQSLIPIWLDPRWRRWRRLGREMDWLT